jgi:hypothetical protein
MNNARQSINQPPDFINQLKTRQSNVMKVSVHTCGKRYENESQRPLVMTCSSNVEHLLNCTWGVIGDALEERMIHHDGQKHHTSKPRY